MTTVWTLQNMVKCLPGPSSASLHATNHVLCYKLHADPKMVTPHHAPFPRITTKGVRSRIATSSHTDQFSR
jgi:hypothetical protein